MSASLPIRVSLYDDNVGLRCSFSKLIGLSDDFVLAGAYGDAHQLTENCRYQMPDVILMDIDMPGISGIEAVRIIGQQFSTIKVLMLTVFDDNRRIFESICSGAVGYILKKEEPDAIFNAIKEAHAGGAPMTNTIAIQVLSMLRQLAPVKEEILDISEREREILTLLTLGYSYKMIAEERKISIDTVRFHIKKIYGKLHVHSMTEAVSKALKNKWV